METARGAEAASMRLARNSRVMVRVDGSPRMGGGHVMRCLTLANALTSVGAKVQFVSALLTDGLRRHVERAGHPVHLLPAVPELLAQTDDWDSTIVSAQGQRQDAEAALAAAGGTDWVVLDHYRFDRHWLEMMGQSRRLIIDDLANRFQPCEILIDQTYGRQASDYLSWVPKSCRILTGAEYALLRPEFAEARPQALRRRRDVQTAERLLISLGSTDIGGITMKALTSVLDAGVECAIDVVLSSSAPSLEPVRALAEAHPKIHLHVDTPKIASLMTKADLAIGAPGMSSWERCCLAVPTVMTVLADTQRLVSRKLADAGAAVLASSAAAIGAAVRQLLEDPAAMARMSAAAAAIVDGEGTRRIIDAMRRGESKEAPVSVLVRAAAAVDSEQLWLWRNDPLVRSVSKNDRPICWRDHSAWFSAILQNPQSRLLIAQVEETPVAMVRFDKDSREAIISINVDPNMRGRGIGAAALNASCALYLRENPATPLVAEIRTSNHASVRTFQSAGFEQCGGTAANGFQRFIRTEG